MMIRYYLLVLFAAIGIEMLNAQAGGSLMIPVDSRSIAMGSTFVTNTESVGLYENLASSSLDTSKWNVGVSYRPWVDDLSDGYDLLSASGRIALNAKHKIAVGYQTLSFPEMSLVDDNGNFEDNFRPNEYRIGLGYAYLLNEHTAVSATIHFFNSEIYQDYSANAVVVDLGFKSQYKSFEYGLSVKNLGSKLNFDNGEVALPLILAGGVGYEKLMSEQHRLRGQMDVSYISTGAEENGIAIGLGGEYKFKSILALRTGYYQIDENVGLNHFSLGAGVDFKSFDLGFAYLLSDNAINGSYSFSLSWRM